MVGRGEQLNISPNAHGHSDGCRNHLDTHKKCGHALLSFRLGCMQRKTGVLMITRLVLVSPSGPPALAGPETNVQVSCCHFSPNPASVSAGGWFSTLLLHLTRGGLVHQLLKLYFSKSSRTFCNVLRDGRLSGPTAGSWPACGKYA